MSEQTETKPRKSYNVDATAFVQAWTECNSTKAVAAKLNMPTNIVLARAANYRKKGVNLKSMSQSRKKLAIDQLNQLIVANGTPGV